MKLVEVYTFGQLLDTIKLTLFSVPELKKVLNLKKETKKIVEDSNDLKKEVMKKYNVQENNGHFDFEKHPQLKEIKSDLEKIDDGYSLSSETNFITFEQLKSSLKEEHNANDLMILVEYLVKE